MSRGVRPMGRALALHGRCHVCGGVLRMLARPDRFVLVCDGAECNRAPEHATNPTRSGAPHHA